MYAVLGSIFTGSLGFYLGYNNLEASKPKEEIVADSQRQSNSFTSSTIVPYTILKKSQNKYIIYSKYHKCQLSTHELITKPLPTPQPKTIQNQQALPITYKQLFQSQYKSYAYQLINSNKCNSVQLIHGPIFSKDGWSKNQQNRHIYFSKVVIDQQGKWIADRYYAIVACNRQEGSYFNGFQHRRPNINNVAKFSFLNNLTSIKKLQEQTGLIFSLKGGQLTMQDYEGLSKIRKFGSAQGKQQADIAAQTAQS